MNVRTSEALRVMLPDSVDAAGGELPGCIFYGLCRPNTWLRGQVPVDRWPEGARGRESFTEGEHWQIAIWDIYMPKWLQGDAWRDAVRGTLEDMVGRGAIVAWLGDEGLIRSPPELFTKGMERGIYAYLTSSGTFRCFAEPERNLAWATAEDARLLRTLSAGVSDRP